MPWINQVSAANVSALASLVSAVAATVALLAVRNTNRIARANLLPVLSFKENNRSLEVKNFGRGPALNLRFLPLTTHYQDMDWMFEYSTKTVTILPGESELIDVLVKDVRDKKAKPSKADSYDILWFAKETDNVDALFEDATGHTHAVRLAFDEKGNTWTLRTQEYLKYGLRIRMTNFLKRKFFRTSLFSKIRLWRFKRAGGQV